MKNKNRFLLSESSSKYARMNLPQDLKIVRTADSADFSCVRVMLFPSSNGVRGWYLSPAGRADLDENVRLSANMIASSAILRAITLAEKLGVDVCIIDPDDLWHEVWGA